MSVLTECSECTNKVDAWADDARPLCDYCYHAEQCPTPKGIEFYQSRMTGEPRARCNKCEFVSAYWECGCDLLHDCKEWKK